MAIDLPRAANGPDRSLRTPRVMVSFVTPGPVPVSLLGCAFVLQPASRRAAAASAATVLLGPPDGWRRRRADVLPAELEGALVICTPCAYWPTPETGPVF